MAFGGAIAALPAPPTGEGPQQFDMALFGLTLAAFVAAPAAIVNADTGELVTAVAGANQNQIPAAFGYGAGNWRSGDQNLVDVEVDELQDATQGAGGQIPDPHVALVAGAFVTFVAGGNLAIRIHNRGLQASPTLRINLRFKPTPSR
jgi:hypothetical protein